MKARMTAAALAAVLLLVGATSAWAAFVVEGSPYTVGDDPLSLNAADFNGDGRPDVATINGTSSNVSVFLRQAGGGFTQEGSPVSVGAGPSAAAVGDYNGDGRADLAVSSFQGGDVRVLLRQPGGGFALEGTVIPLGQTHAVATGDFNSDGRLDLVATTAVGQLVRLLRNPANTGFTEQTPRLATGAAPVAIAVGDYNGDGFADLAIANRGSGTVTILLRAGAGFSPEAAVSVGADPIGIVAADFDGNGRADFAVTNAAGSTVSAFLRRPSNDGFTGESPIPVSGTPVGIDAADFDRDGRPDLAVAANAGAVDVLFRNAGGGFTRDQPIALAAAVNDVVAADFDGDSRPDLAATSYTNTAAPDTFSALLNPAPPAPPGQTLPPPVAGKSVNVEPVSGKVRIKRPGRKRFVTLTAEAQIPVGSSIDTRRGRIAITAAQGRGKTATADFYAGLFKLTQTKGRKPVATLKLTEKLSCARANRATTAAKKKKKRRLWGDGNGRFRTDGKYSAATVRGTKWLTEDRCTSTLTRVVRGRVAVRDRVKRKTVIVRAGKKYTARAKRR
ncbi:MAG TPA: VCBS repeat-containing protein [Solirubrobacteraceae bacterium]|nr:VCBS repeat-containing protein [Solirubrobacteraceae bacterium]